MKIRNVKLNNHKREFVVDTSTRVTYAFPYAKAELDISADDPIQEVYVDPEIGNEGFTYVLSSGNEGTVHIDHVLEYNEDPKYMADLQMHKLTVEAIERLEASGLSRRHIARRLNTSLPQLYRLLDTTNYRKSMQQLITLLRILDCDVEVVVRERPARYKAG